jgi:hypothetical protein
MSRHVQAFLYSLRIRARTRGDGKCLDVGTCLDVRSSTSSIPPKNEPRVIGREKMSVTSINPDVGAYEYGDKPQECFLCNNELVSPLVHWHGSGHQQLWLHHGCAQKLALSLLYDAQRAEALVRKKSLTGGIHLQLDVSRISGVSFFENTKFDAPKFKGEFNHARRS